MGVPEKRAVGIIRVSRVGGREGERFISPDDQRKRIEDACARDGMTLVAVHEELDVSGGNALADRRGLNAAVAAIEAGKAEIVAAAYFDRLFRSLSTQREVIDRVEAAGGEVLAIDIGRVSNGNASQRLTGTMLGAVAEYHRVKTKETLADVQEHCVARGAPPWSRVPLGYTRQDDGTYAPDPQTLDLARRVFEMRDQGAPITDIRLMLLAHGDGRSNRGVQVMLANRIYLGELHFGELVNLQACEPIIDRELFERVQRLRVPRGPKPKSNMLLARLGVLRCGSCGARMSVWTMPQGGGYATYVCGSTSICPKHMVISAKIAEDKIIAWVKQHLAGITGTASGASGAEEAREQLDAAQAALDDAMRSFADAGLGGEPVALETLDGLREARDLAKGRHDEALAADESLTVAVTVGDWDELNQDERRALVKATIARAVVHSGRGPERIEIVAR
jgi:site-specific DNA recombinase